MIFNASPTGNAGDAIYLQGSGFGSSPAVQYSYNDSNWKSFPSVTSTHDTVIVKIPASERNLPELVTVRLSSDNVSWSNIIYLNRAHAMSFDTDQVSAGATFRVFGRNLYFARTPTVRFVDTAGSAQYFATVAIASSSDYMLSVSAPAAIQAGHTYQIYVSNGYNGNGSSGAETLADQSLVGGKSDKDYWNLGAAWASDLSFYGNIYNVRTDSRLSSHATGNGSTNEQNAINGAIWAAYKAGGGIVYLPTGTYKLLFANGCGLTLLPRVALVGDGAGKTTINYGYGGAPSPDHGGYGVCFAINQSGVSDMTLNNVNESGNWPQNALATNGNELFIQRVVWDMSTSLPITLPAADRLAIENSTFTQEVDSQFNYNGIFELSGASHFLIKGNNINFACGGIDLDNASDGVFEDNQVMRDASAILPSSVITHVMTAGFVRNFVVLNNIFSVQNGTLGGSNDGETINDEAGGANRRDEFRGTVTSFSNVSLTDANQNFYSSSNSNPTLQAGQATVAIVSGTGNGQWRNVTGLSPDGHTIYLDQPWTVSPDTGSNYATFDWSAFNWIVANNTMSGNEKGIEFFNASALDVLIEANSLTDNSGILLSPEQAGPSLSNLIAHMQILNNSIMDKQGLRPAYVGNVPREDQQTSSFGTSILGLEARGNNILAHHSPALVTNTSFDDSKALVEGFNSYWQWQTDWTTYEDLDIPASLGVVFQSNSVVNGTSAYVLDSAMYQTMLQDTLVRGGGNLEDDMVIAGASHGSIGTTVDGVWHYIPIAGISEPLESVQTLSSSNNGATFFVSPASSSVNTGSGGSDSFGLVSQQATGDTIGIARITLPAGADASVAGFLTMRDSSAPTSAFASVGPVYGNQVSFTWRTKLGAAVQTKRVTASAASSWLKLVKGGSTFTAYESADGINWTTIGSASATFTSSPYNVGLAGLSNGSQSGLTIRFDKVDMEPNGTNGQVLASTSAVSVPAVVDVAATTNSTPAKTTKPAAAAAQAPNANTNSGTQNRRFIKIDSSVFF